MTTDYTIDCEFDADVQETLIHEICYVLVSRGTTYNGGSYPGSYRIGPEDGEYVDHWETEAEDEMVERLPDILREYCSYDLEQTTLSVDLADVRAAPIDYTFGVTPHGDGRTTVSVTSSTNDAGTSERFLRLVGNVRELCRRFDVRYAAFRGEHETRAALSPAAFSSDHLRRVTYLDADFVDAIGRERIRSMPAHEIDEFDDGGILVTVCDQPTGDEDRLERAREHLAV